MNAPAICFDARMSHASGIGTYIRGLLGEISCSSVSFTPTLLTGRSDGLPTTWPKIHVTSRFYSPLEQITVPWAFHRSRAAILHVPHYNIPVCYARRCVVTVHDLIHLKFPEFLASKLARTYAQMFFHYWVPQARAILTVSEHTKKDLIEMLHIPESKITVTAPGVPDGFRPQSPTEYEPILARLKLEKGYFLYVGNLKEFKNVPHILKAYREIKRRRPDAPPLVMVGRNFIQGFELEMAATPGVRWLSEVDQPALPSLYSAARAFVFPSLYEGFGLPPLEAMACGAPVICSDRASLPEVVGDAALLTDPLSLESLVSAMCRILDDPTLARRLSDKGLQRSKQFSWKTTAEKTLGVYNAVLS